MIQIAIRNISLPFTADKGELFAAAYKKIRPCLSRKDILSISLYKRSVDARKRDDIRFVSTVVVETDADETALNPSVLAKCDAVILNDSTPVFSHGEEKLSASPVIAGFGPCGMFCAMILAENGYNPIVLERGGDIDSRAEAVSRFLSEKVLDESSNIQFGAGGAGTFSDGKLVTRVNDPLCHYVLKRLHALGAPDEILTQAKPHIGTDKLRGIVRKADEYIRSLGGDIRYNTPLTSVNIRGNTAYSVSTPYGDIPCGAVILATGHSARDTYEYLIREGYDIVPKPFSVGVRIEHLREDIDKAMYGDHAGDPRLGPAEYTLSRRRGDIGVYTFCMCPGGEVIAAASECGGVVTNGMSRYARDGRNSNAAVAVSVSPDNPIEFQRSLERAAFTAGGGDYSAPVQTFGDFLEGKAVHEPSKVKPTYMDGKAFRVADINRILPADVCDMLKMGISSFERQIEGFSAPYALLTGVETRTSAPLRIMRDVSFTSPHCRNVYPAGEGAGYAGGITSAALDGIAVASKLMERYR